MLDSISLSNEVVVSRCQDVPVPVVTSVAPMKLQQTLYIAASNCLYALEARNGAVRWCQQVSVHRTYSYHPGISMPPPSHAIFGTPRVFDDVIYTCVSGHGGFTCAFNAGDGTLRWSTATDGWIVSMPFRDYAVPIVQNGVVYNGTYALREVDGSILWRINIDVLAEGALSLHTLADDVLYGNTQKGVYAINAENGEIRWLFEPDNYSIISGPLVVSDHVLYVGTSGSVDHPERSCFYALNADTGEVSWKYSMGSYIGAAVHQGNVFVSSGDLVLYSLDKQNGSSRWKYKLARPGHYPATVEKDVLYVNNDGVYAINSADGSTLWHQSLGSSPSIYFTPSVVLDEVVLLARIDGHGRSVLYALNASNGMEYWHCDFPLQLAPIAVLARS